MLKSMVRRLLGAILDRPLPSPSNEEKCLASELQAAFRELRVSDTADALPSEATWLSNTNRLRELVLSRDPRRFLRWDVVTRTMFVSSGRFVSAELKYLKHRPDWNTRWRMAIDESPVGGPLPFIFYPASSGNLVTHAYHVAQFEDRTGVQVNDLDYVFEFGGGYGSMCRLFCNLGFRGRYVIFDLPAFSALQRYYLSALGLPVQSAAELVALGTGIACVSDALELGGLLTDRIDTTGTMFVATWSLSESPIGIRDSILPLVSEFQSFLIGYQDRFGEVNNVEFFDSWKQTIGNVAWHGWRIEHLPGNSYLVGRATADSQPLVAVGSASGLSGIVRAVR
jgi:hypothetical protein